MGDKGTLYRFERFKNKKKKPHQSYLKVLLGVNSKSVSLGDPAHISIIHFQKTFYFPLLF